jgi:hypothetical protein
LTCGVKRTLTRVAGEMETDKHSVTDTCRVEG